MLANPAYRFGFDCTINAGGVLSANYGQPREYVSTIPLPAVPTPQTSFFIGRFTHSETSDLAFGYPAYLPAVNPMNSTQAMNYNTTTGAVGPGGGTYAGPRGGEDVLMTNVLKFDIKVFDPAASTGTDGLPGTGGIDDDGDGNIVFCRMSQFDLKEYGWPGSDDGDFRDIGHMGLTGFYNATTSTAARTASPRNVPITMLYSLPNTATPADLVNAKLPASTQLQFVYPNTNYNYGYVPANSPPGALYANRYDTWNPSLDLDNDLKPERQALASGHSVIRQGRQAWTERTDDDGINGPDDVGEIGWPGSDDTPIPLSAIQIKITFYDRTSKQVRETTLVQSLLYQP